MRAPRLEYPTKERAALTRAGGGIAWLADLRLW